MNNVGKIKIALSYHRCHQKHVECQPTKMRQDEQAVQNLIFCMDGFNTVPFDENATELRSG